MEREARPSPRIADGCTLHAGEPFTAICRRCGTYMCPRCNEQGRFETCEPCRAELSAQSVAATVPFPFPRDGVVWGALLRFCFGVYTRHWAALTIAVVAAGGALLGVHLLATALLLAAPLADMLLAGALIALIEMMVAVFALAVLLDVSLRAFEGGTLNLGPSLRTSLRRFPALLALCAIVVVAASAAQFVLVLPVAGALTFFENELTLANVVLTAFCFLLAVALHTYVLLGLLLAPLELVAHPETGIFGALRNSWRIAHTQRLTIGFGLFLISLLATAGLLMCGIGLVFTLPYQLILYAALYRALRNGPPFAST